VKPVTTFEGNVVWVPEKVRSRIGILDYHFSHSMGDTEYGLRADRNGIAACQAPSFCGTCELHLRMPVWSDPERPLSQRLKALRSPLGCPPSEHFYLQRKYYGLPVAAFHYVTLYMKTYFPRLWVLRDRIRNRKNGN